jgi:predicted TIM-barrel fold metal-dependent hydrolase
MHSEWLAQVTEDIIEPDLPICDPHHHLWDHADNPYLLPDLLADTGSGHNVVSTVFVECSSMYRADGPDELKPVGETEFVNGVAAMTASGRYGGIRACAGIVSYTDLTLGEGAGVVLDEHMRLSDRFRGIRHAAGWDADDRVRNSHTNPPEHLYLQDDFRLGFAELEKRNLSFDAWLYQPQIPELTDLAKAFPNVTIVFDHFGGPLGIGPYAGKGDEIFERWCVDAAELAKCDNVYDEIVEATGRYHRKAIEVFGPERCMFESNFPVDKQSCSYPVLWNAFKKIAADFNADDKGWLFHDTAAEAYRL